MSAVQDKVILNDGTQLGLLKPGSVDDATWEQVKEWLKTNPQKATVMQQSVKEMCDNPMKVEQFREVCCSSLAWMNHGDLR